MEECHICRINTVHHNNNCIECKNSWCNSCAIKMSSGLVNNTNNVGIIIKCPYCKTSNDKSIVESDDNIAISIMKTQFFELKEQNKKNLTEYTDLRLQIGKLTKNILDIKADYDNMGHGSLEMKKSLVHVTHKIAEFKNKKRKTISIEELELQIKPYMDIMKKH